MQLSGRCGACHCPHAPQRCFSPFGPVAISSPQSCRNRRAAAVSTCTCCRRKNRFWQLDEKRQFPRYHLQSIYSMAQVMAHRTEQCQFRSIYILCATDGFAEQSALPASVRSLRSPVWIATIRPVAGRTIRSLDLRLQLRNPDAAIFCLTYSLLQDLDAVHEDCPAWHVSTDRLQQRVAVLMPGNGAPDSQFIPNETALAGRLQELLEQFRVNVGVSIQRPHCLGILVALKIPDQKCRLSRGFQVELKADTVDVRTCDWDHNASDCRVISLVSSTKISSFNLYCVIADKPHPHPCLRFCRNDAAGSRL